jgi:hypothetical protein
VHPEAETQTMRFHHTLLALSLFAALPACAAPQDNQPDAAPPRQPASVSDATNPMANYARLVGDEWQLKAPGMSAQMFNTWHWGPGRHSARVMTNGVAADGNPWRGIGVHYWHPGRKQICLLALSTFQRQVSVGTITFDPGGAAADGRFDLFHPRFRRTMGLRWDFIGPDQYHDILLEATGPEGLLKMNEWDHVRVRPPVPPRPLGVAGAEPSDVILPLMRLCGTWEATINTPDAGAMNTKSTIHWIPLADGLYARVTAPSAAAEAESSVPTHLFDVYLHNHHGAKALRCLALSNDGTVYEGEVTALPDEDGSLQIDLNGDSGDQKVSLAVRLDFDADSKLRHRVWSVQDTERPLLLDIHHTKSGPPVD